MQITRYAYESITRIYEFDIDDDYIKDMNAELDTIMQGKPHPVITKEHIISLLKKEEIPAFDKVIVEANEYWEDTLSYWIRDYISTDIWNADSYIDDEETHAVSDDITLSAEEEKQYKEYRKTREENSEDNI